MKIKTGAKLIYAAIVLSIWAVLLTNCKKENQEKTSIQLTVDTTTISFGMIQKIGEVKTKKIIIYNSGDEATSWHATTDKSWLQLNQSSGEVYSENDTIVVTFNSSTLNYGDNTAEITITPSRKDISGVSIKIKVTASNNIRIIDGYMLSKDEIWSGNILLRGDIKIPLGFSLTINPGTKIMVSARNLVFDGGFDDHVVDLFVDGNLFIKGTSQDIVQFMSVEDIATNEDWWGIGLSGTSRVEMTYCSIRNSSYGLFIFSGSTFAPIIKNCLFTNVKSSIVDFGNLQNTFAYNAYIDVDYGYKMFGSNRHIQLNNSEFANIKYTDIQIAGVQVDTTSNATVDITNSNFSNNQWFNIYWEINGYVKNSKITATNCYGILKYPTNENGNTVELQNQLQSPNQNVGCGFNSTIKSQSMKSSSIDNERTVQRDFEKALMFDRRNKMNKK